MTLSLLAEGDLIETAENFAGKVEAMGYTGFAVAMIGVALCVLLCGIGSAIGLFKTGSAAAGVLGEAPDKFEAGMTPSQGWGMLGAVIPMAVSGLVTGIFQGKSSANCIYAVGKQDSLGGKLIIYPAMIEFYAILGLIISIMLIPLVG